MLDIIELTLALNQQSLTEYRLSKYPADILIQPDVSDIGLLDFHRGERAILKGEEAAHSALPSIRASMQRRISQKES